VGHFPALLLKKNFGCRSLYGQCIFSQKVKANTDLADELLAATKSPQFAANALQLQASFNSAILPYETEYWATTAAGVHLLICHYTPSLHARHTAKVCKHSSCLIF
jgi:hypothetical protein